MLWYLYYQKVVELGVCVQGYPQLAMVSSGMHLMTSTEDGDEMDFSVEV